MLLQDLKVDVTTRRERIMVHLKNCQPRFNECRDKTAHRQYEKDLLFLEFLWDASSIDELSAELKAGCSSSLLKDLEQYFKMSKEVRYSLCTLLQTQFHQQHGLPLPNPEHQQIVKKLKAMGLSEMAAQKILTSGNREFGEIAVRWAQLNTPRYCQVTATHPDEARENLREMLRGMRKQPVAKVNAKLKSFGLSDLPCEVQDFSQICDGIRQAILYLDELTQ